MRRVLVIFLLLLACCAPAQTPESVVQSFADALNKRDFDAAAKFVKGGVVGEFLKGSGLLASVPSFTISDLQSAVSGDFALVTFQFKGGAQQAMADYLVLARAGSGWLIDMPMRPDGLAFMAYLLSNPAIFSQAHAAAQRTECLSNAKQIALGLIMLEGDNDDVLKVTAANWQKKISEYVKMDQIFTCPLDPPGTTSYSINANLIGKSATSIEQPALTVLVYEGKGGQLNFRHAGRATVAFADGHAKQITKEEAKNLRWKP